MRRLAETVAAGRMLDEAELDELNGLLGRTPVTSGSRTAARAATRSTCARWSASPTASSPARLRRFSAALPTASSAARSAAASSSTRRAAERSAGACRSAATGPASGAPCARSGKNPAMFDHVTIRASDRSASERFYETVLRTLGIEQSHSDEHYVEWNDFGLAATAESPRRRAGCTSASRRRRESTWTSSGGWAPRPGYQTTARPACDPQYSDDYYGAFLLDPDGNSAEAVHHGSPRDGGNVDHLWIRVSDLDASTRVLRDGQSGCRVPGRAGDRRAGRCSPASAARSRC